MFEQYQASKLTFGFPAEAVQLAIASPITGQVSSIDAESYRSLGVGIQAALENGDIKSPVNGKILEIDHAIAQVTIKATNGLKILMQLPFDWRQQHGLAIKKLAAVGQMVTVGETIFRFDLYKMQRITRQLPFYVIILNHSKLRQVFVPNKYIGATNDPLFLLAINKKN